MKRIRKRFFALIPALVIQGVWYFVLFHWLRTWAAYINIGLSLLAMIFVLYLINKLEESSYKILWILVLVGFPVMGALLYLMFGNKRTTWSLKRKLDANTIPREELMKKSVLNEIDDVRFRETLAYMEQMAHFPVLKNEKVAYAPIGEELYAMILEQLEKAEKYIFIEYFILDKGKMWDPMVQILERKVNQGVDVRVLYDDVGSLSTFSMADVRELRRKGILCIPFNPLVYIKGTLNYRDHRKMLIIDGKIAFSGGVNIADEYINAYEKYGHWKDIGFCIEGDAVRNYVVMFAEFWNAYTPDRIPDELIQESCGNRCAESVDTSNAGELAVLTDKSESSESAEGTKKEDGYIFSYYDSPLKDENISNELYIELLSQAKEYVYFYTPYLILGDSLLEAFTRAAKRGVDICIIMPGIPDKKMIFRMAHSFYPILLEHGVKIYEYTPGFIHAKGCVVDGRIATIGSVNLDYRSLFLHFENNSLFYHSKVIQELETDMLQTMEQCKEIQLGTDIKVSFRRWFVDGILRIVSPLC